MLSSFVTFAINALLSVLTPDKIQGFIAAGSTAVKEYAESTASTVDDLLVPACSLVLVALDIPGPDGKIDVTGEMKKLFECLKSNKNIFIDAGLDFIEDKVKESPTKLDDVTVLPLCELVRKVLKVPDED